ncbi:hypothetical protein PilKf_01839 [Pillotina sp. SPG140]|jgi:hypothetical protein
MRKESTGAFVKQAEIVTNEASATAEAAEILCILTDTVEELHRLADQTAETIRITINSLAQARDAGRVDGTVVSAVESVTIHASDTVTYANETAGLVEQANHLRDQSDTLRVCEEEALSPVLSESLETMLTRVRSSLSAQADGLTEAQEAHIHTELLQEALSIGNMSTALQTLETLQEVIQRLQTKVLHGVKPMEDTVQSIIQPLNETKQLVHDMNGFSRTLRQMLSKILSSPVHVLESVPDMQKRMLALVAELQRWKGLFDGTVTNAIQQDLEALGTILGLLGEVLVGGTTPQAQALSEQVQAGVDTVTERIIAQVPGLPDLYAGGEILQQLQTTHEAEQFQRLADQLTQHIRNARESVDQAIIALTATAQEYSQKSAQATQQTHASLNVLKTLYKTLQESPESAQSPQIQPTITINDTTTIPELMTIVDSLIHQAQQLLTLFSTSIVGVDMPQTQMTINHIQTTLTSLSHVLESAQQEVTTSSQQEESDTTQVLHTTPQRIYTAYKDHAVYIRSLHTLVKDIRPYLDQLLVHESDIRTDYIDTEFALDSYQCAALLAELIDQMETIITDMYRRSYLYARYEGFSNHTYIKVPLKFGDTLEKLAYTYLGNADYAYILAVYNGIASLDGLSPGSTIKIPSSGALNQHNRNEVYDTSDSYDILGRDIALDDSLHIRARGDVLTVSGSANLEQAIILRLREHTKKRIRLTVYGLNVTFGSPVMSSNYIHSSLRNTLAREPRVDYINAISFQGAGDELLVLSIIRTYKDGSRQSEADYNANKNLY